MQKEEAAKEALKKALGVLEGHLASRTFLVGHNVTLADIVACANLYNGYTKVRGISVLCPPPACLTFPEGQMLERGGEMHSACRRRAPAAEVLQGAAASANTNASSAYGAVAWRPGDISAALPPVDAGSSRQGRVGSYTATAGVLPCCIIDPAHAATADMANDVPD